MGAQATRASGFALGAMLPRSFIASDDMHNARLGDVLSILVKNAELLSRDLFCVELASMFSLALEAIGHKQEQDILNGTDKARPGAV